MPALADLIPFAIAGIGAGLWLLWRGFGAYRTAGRIEGTSTSRIASIAAGEIRITGTVEPAEVALVSALQSRRCVYYRSRISETRGPGGGSEAFDEERAVGFVVNDGTGAIRVFPRGATFDVPERFDESETWTGTPPSGLELRSGPAYTAARPDREARIAALLTVRDPTAGGGSPARDGSVFGLDNLVAGLDGGRRARRYREALIETGDVVTILGRAVPFGTIDDPAHADLAVTDRLHPMVDAEIAATIAAARADGTLAPDAATAWGNAAIPGFGIGRPATAPVLDPDADRPALAGDAAAAEAERTFTISPEALVVVASTEVPLLVSAGPPGVATARHEDRFLVGLLGATLAIASAIVLALGVAATLP